MVTIPSIDLFNGQVVRLKKGLISEQTIYTRTPLEALKWLEGLGASRIHIVDLNAAFGESPQIQLLKDLAKAARVPLQIGGGIRTLENIFTLKSMGYSWTVISSGCFMDKGFLSKALEIDPETLILALDLKDRQIAIKGWTESTGMTIEAFLAQNPLPNCVPLLVTDISKDGLLEGPSFNLYRSLMKSVPNPIMASGGIRNLVDIQALDKLGLPYGIMGKALYEEKLPHKEVHQCLQNALFPV